MVRTRFAPSPTGYLHIGGVRTALFNWLFARKHGGQFILRIDDTDAERNVEAALLPILHGFEWLGIDWDEGPTPDGKGNKGPHAPYFQSQRSANYQAAVEKLLASGHAYRDYADPQEIQKLREAAEKEKRNFVYPRDWADLAELPENAARVAAAKSADRKPIVRLKMPREGKLLIPDLIRGDVEFPWANEQDHVIQRADGTCLYHLASVVDDYDMRITHVIRAEEHLSNTPRQIFIAQSLGYELPIYAHLPYVAEPGSKTKLSKRKLDKYLKNKEFATLHLSGSKLRNLLFQTEVVLKLIALSVKSKFPDENDFSVNKYAIARHMTLYDQFKGLPEWFIVRLLEENSDNFSRFLRDENLHAFISDFKLIEELNKKLANQNNPETFNPVIVDFYEQVGYLPHAIVNYLLLLGWSLDGTTEYFTRDEMIANFSLERVNKAPASFDPKKLMAFEDHYFQELPAKQKTPRMIDYLKKAGLLPAKTDCDTGPYVTKIVQAAGDRMKVFGDILNFAEFFVDDDNLEIDQVAFEKTFAKPEAKTLLAGFRDALTTVEPFEVGPLEEALQAFVAERGIKAGDLIHPVRLALCGKTVGMGLYDTLAILGRERCISRIDRLLAQVV